MGGNYEEGEMMLPFLNGLSTALKANFTLYAPISMNGLSVDPESVCLRVMPSAPGEAYYDGTHIRVVQFQILTKSKNQATAAQAIESFYDFLYQKHFTVTGYRIITLSPISEPSYLERLTTGEYIFTSTYRAEIIKE